MTLNCDRDEPLSSPNAEGKGKEEGEEVKDEVEAEKGDRQRDRVRQTDSKRWRERRK